MISEGVHGNTLARGSNSRRCGSQIKHKNTISITNAWLRAECVLHGCGKESKYQAGPVCNTGKALATCSQELPFGATPGARSSQPGSKLPILGAAHGQRR